MLCWLLRQLNTAILSFQPWFWLASSEFALCLVLYLRPSASAELARALICHSATLICVDMDPARFATHPAVVVIVILVLLDICLHKLETSGCEGNLCSPEVSGD